MKKKKVLVVVNKIIDHSGPTKSLIIYNHLVASTANQFDISVFCLSHSALCSDFRSQLNPKIFFHNPKRGLRGFFVNFFLFIRLIFSCEYDIVQSHLTFSNAVCLFCKLIGSKPSLICTIHNKEDYMRGVKVNLMYRILGFIETRLAFLSSLYICVSPSLHKYLSLRLKKYCLFPVRSTSIYNCYDASRFGKDVNSTLSDIRESLNIPPASMIFGTIGLLIPRKNQICSIKLLSMLRNKGIDIHLILLGEGPDLKKLEDYSFSLGVNNYTHFLGHKPNVEAYLPSFDFYFHPSLAEGFGLAVLEALMSSVPCITSDVEGLKDVMNSNTGFVVDINNETDVLSAALSLCNDYKLRQYISMQSKSECMRRFSPEIICSEYVKAFDSIDSRTK